MKLSFKVLGTTNLRWLKELRNSNKEWFIDSNEVTDNSTWQWFNDSCSKGDLNLILVLEDEKIGFLSIYNRNKDSANIGRMMMDDKYKHKGYMEDALIKVFDVCRLALNIKLLILEVKSSNVPARNLYTKMGFVTYGITADSLIMRKVI